MTDPLPRHWTDTLDVGRGGEAVLDAVFGLDYLDRPRHAGPPAPGRPRRAASWMSPPAQRSRLAKVCRP